MPENKSLILYLNLSDKRVIPVSIEDICFIQYFEQTKFVGVCTKAGFVYTQDDFWKLSKPLLDHCGKDCAYMYMTTYDYGSGAAGTDDMDKVPVRFPISNSNNGVFVLYNKNLIDYIDKGSVEAYQVINSLFIKGIISKEKFTGMIGDPESWITSGPFSSESVRNILNRLEPDHKLFQAYIELVRNRKIRFLRRTSELNENTQDYISSRLLPELTTDTTEGEKFVQHLASSFSYLTLPLQQEVLNQVCKRHMYLSLPAGYIKMSMISNEVKERVETDQYSRFLFLSIIGEKVFYEDKDYSELKDFISGLRHKFLTDLNDSFFTDLNDSFFFSTQKTEARVLDREVSVLMEMKDEPFISGPENRKKWLHYLISTALQSEQIKGVQYPVHSKIVEIIYDLDLRMSPDFLPEARDYLIKLFQVKPVSAPDRRELGTILRLYYRGFIPKEVLLKRLDILKKYSSGQSSNTLLGLLLSGIIPESSGIYENLKTKLSNRNPGLKVLFHGLTKGMELN